MMSGGEHGGYCGITGPFRRLSGSSQDIMSRVNRTMRDSLESAFKAKPPLMYAAGHDHNLQVMKGAPNAKYFVVSGVIRGKSGMRRLHARELLRQPASHRVHAGGHSQGQGGCSVSSIIQEPEFRARRSHDGWR